MYLVNPRGIPVHGQDSYARVADLPQPVDLAFVMVPTSAVLGVLAEVADAGIPSVVLLTSGFAEVGEEGAELERQVVELARRRGLTILGPNGNGFINAAARITPYGLPIDAPLLGGPVGVVLQSGALASSVLTFAQARNVGVSLLVSMGNESMVSMTDVIRYLIDDDATRVIALFIESVRRPIRIHRRWPARPSRRASRSSRSRSAAARPAPGSPAPTPARWSATTRSSTRCSASTA